MWRSKAGEGRQVFRSGTTRQWEVPPGRLKRSLGSDLSFPLGVRLLRIQSYGRLRAERGRGGAQGEEEDPICCAGLRAHQLGPSASGDGEQAADRSVFDPKKNEFCVSDVVTAALTSLM